MGEGHVLPPIVVPERYLPEAIKYLGLVFDRIADVRGDDVLDDELEAAGCARGIVSVHLTFVE